MKLTIELPEDMYEGSMNLELETKDYKQSICIGGGSPEDMCLARDLSDALSIPDLILAAYDAGKAGEPLEVIRTKTDNDES
jgi:hypothetical protein